MNQEQKIKANKLIAKSLELRAKSDDLIIISEQLKTISLILRDKSKNLINLAIAIESLKKKF